MDIPNPIPPMASATDYTKVLSDLNSTINIASSAIARVPKLAGEDNYVNWSDQLHTALKCCGLEKFLTGEWEQPAVTAGEAASEDNLKSWNILDDWVWLQFTLAPDIFLKVSGLGSSHEKWDKLKKLYKPIPQTSITHHLNWIVNVPYDQSIKFEDFVARKCEHNRLLGEIGGHALPDSYIAILIRSGLPENLKQTVAHIPDDTIGTDQLVKTIQSRYPELPIYPMRSSPLDTAFFGPAYNGKQNRRDLPMCENPNCHRPMGHPTQNCWSPGGPKYNPNFYKSNKRGKERTGKEDGDEELL